MSARFGDTENSVIIVGAGIAGLSAAASQHKVTMSLALLFAVAFVS